MKTRNQEQTEIAATIATFPAKFGLRAFPGDTFRVSPMSSYFSGDTMYLYTERLAESGMWQSFAKGTAGELRLEVVALPSVGATAPPVANDKPSTDDMSTPAITRSALVEVLASHADDATDNHKDAQHIALRLGRCGSPFTYQVIEVAADHFLVVNHIEASLYRALLQAVN